MKDGQLFHILSYGQGSMAPMAGQLSRADRWHVVNYVRSMQESAKNKAAASDGEADAKSSEASKSPTDEKEPDSQDDAAQAPAHDEAKQP